MSEQWITDEQIADARRSATAWSQYTPDNTRKAIEKAANHILELCDALDAQQAELAAAHRLLKAVDRFTDDAELIESDEKSRTFNVGYLSHGELLEAWGAYDALRQGSGEGAGDEPDTDV